MYSELTKMEEKRIVIRTFGYFDIFVDGETIPFHVRKPKNCWHFWLTEEEDL